MSIAVYDIETLSNCFTCVTVDIQTMEKREFVIHKSRNDFKGMVQYLTSLSGMIGFNSVGFDYMVLHPFLLKPEDYYSMRGETLAKHLYKRAQQVIDWGNPENRGKREYIAKHIVPQRDLYLIWHFNNKARSTSLKWLQVCMGWSNVQEMPISHSTNVTAEMIPTILGYNTNDVMSTLEFYNRSKDRIVLRKDLTEKYGTDMGNFSDTRIGEEIFLIGLAEKTGMSRQTLAKGRTPRSQIIVNEFLIDNIKFETPGFQRILEEYKNMVITDTKKTGSMSCVYNGVQYEFGFGGLHGFREAGLYHNIVSADVSSYYPNLAISLGLHPKHLGQAFCDVYKQLYEDRKKYPKGSAENAALKLSLNGTFGASNAEWSPFYDPQFTMSITILGQLLLAMLCERITESGAGRIIMANTDGIEVDVESPGMFEWVCSDWQEEFTLILEFATYKVLACRDVNNYLGIYENGKTKEKGEFEVDKELFKDQSMKIIPIAVREYFVNGTPVEQTISDCKDIGKFLIGHRAKTGNLRFRAAKELGTLIDEPVPKTVRYYISKQGGSIVKITKQEKRKKKSDAVISPNQLSMFGQETPNSDEKVMVDKVTNLHSGYAQVLFNKWEKKPFKQYNVNLQFYVNAANKLVNSVLHNQTVIS
jgi:hypothetical protein